MAKSQYLENAVLNGALNATTWTAPTTVYVGLFTTSPSPTGGGSEVSTSGTGYARESAAFTTSTTGSTSNSGNITYPTATGSGWGTIAYFAIFDAVTSGNMLYYGALTTSKVINVGDTCQFTTGNLVATES